MRGQIRDGACADRGDSFRRVSGYRTNRCPQHVGLCVSSCPGSSVLPVINSPARQACTGSQCPACCLEVTESKRQPLLPKNIWAVGTVQGGHRPDRFYDVRLEPLASGHSPHPRRPVACSVHPADTDLCPSPQRQAVLSAGLQKGSEKHAGLAGQGKTGDTFASSKAFLPAPLPLSSGEDSRRKRQLERFRDQDTRS